MEKRSISFMTLEDNSFRPIFCSPMPEVPFSTWIRHVWSMPVKLNGQVSYQPFNVVENMEFNIVGTPFLQAIHLSYDAVKKEIFAIHPDSPPTTVTLQPYETKTAQGQIRSFSTQITIIQNPDFPMLMGGPAITTVMHDELYNQAITNGRPCKITLPRGTILAELEPSALQQQLIHMDGDHLNQFLNAKPDPCQKKKKNISPMRTSEGECTWRCGTNTVSHIFNYCSTTNKLSVCPKPIWEEVKTTFIGFI